MERIDALKELLANVEAGEAAGKFGPIMSNWWGGDSQIDAMRAYNGSLDAAKALHDDVLPGWTTTHAHGHRFNWSWNLTKIENSGKRYACAESTTPARAWLCAILKALIAQEES